MKNDQEQPYSRRRHITARELRGLGFYLSEMIPNEAFVRRIAVDLDPTEPVNDGTPTCRLLVAEPFIDPTHCLVEMA
jgi:hypothetical protein